MREFNLNDVCESLDDQGVLDSGGILENIVKPVSSSLDSRITAVSGGLQTQIDKRPTSSGAELIASGAAVSVLSGGALPKDKPFSTTVGGYTITYTSNGGLSIYGENEHGPGVSASFANGAVSLTAIDGYSETEYALVINGSGGVTISGADGVGDTHARVTLNGGDVAVSADGSIAVEYYNSELASASLSLGYGGLHLGYQAAGSASLSVVEGAVLFNGDISGFNGLIVDGSTFTQAISRVADTSLGIEELSDGVKYYCESALSGAAALSIGSAAPGCNATIFFALASGAIVTPPANVPYFGVESDSFIPGSNYVMAINGDMAVCVEAVRGPEPGV